MTIFILFRKSNWKRPTIQTDTRTDYAVSFMKIEEIRLQTSDRKRNTYFMTERIHVRTSSFMYIS
jgi:hypothetical protein